MRLLFFSLLFALLLVPLPPTLSQTQLDLRPGPYTESYAYNNIRESEMLGLNRQSRPGLVRPGASQPGLFQPEASQLRPGLQEGLAESRNLRGYGEGPPGPPVPVTDDLCEKLIVYDSEGRKTDKGAKNWSTSAATSAFVAGPCLKIPGIHTAQRMDKSIVISDRSQTVNSAIKYPGTRRPVIAIELAWGTWQQRNLDLLTENYCSTGAFMPDGSLLSLGGFVPVRNPYRTAVRGIPKCPPQFTQCNCTVLGNLSSYRWYPTAQILPEGRVFVIGGSAGATAINNAVINNPTFEYWPPRNPGDSRMPLLFLKVTLGYNLYPIVHLLPSGRVFIFAGTSYTLFDTSANNVVPGNYPRLLARGQARKAIFRNYPNAGSSALFPLKPSDSYSATVMICGGCGFFRQLGEVAQRCEDRCWMIDPESAQPTWVDTPMCQDYPDCTVRVPRVMCDAVLLADGRILVINGGRIKAGTQPISASQPVMTPIMYDPYTKEWYTETLATSFVPRMYHSNALLLHDGTVFLSGSNPNNAYTLSGRFPSESRTEFFVPPYFFTGEQPPVLTYSPSQIRVAGSFDLCFKSSQVARPGETLSQRFRFALSHPGLSTHGQRHSMRHIDLEFSVRSRKEGFFIATVKGPPNLNIAPPTFYWLFVLDHGVPNKEGSAVVLSNTIRRRRALPSQCYR